MDSFLDSLIDLQLSSLDIPQGFDFRFNALNEQFQEKSQSASAFTFHVLDELVSYILRRPVSDNETDFFVESDRAVTTLLASRDLDILHRRPALPLPRELRKSRSMESAFSFRSTFQSLPHLFTPRHCHQ
jgi:hypothetical protein